MSYSIYGDGQEMTVAELIERLSRFDGSTKVGIGGPSGFVSFIAAVAKEGSVVTVEIGDCVYED